MSQPDPMQPCPEPDELAAFDAGTMRNRSRFHAIQVHIEDCSDCLAALEILADNNDPILTALRGGSEMFPHQSEPGCEAAVRRVRAIASVGWDLDQGESSSTTNDHADDICTSESLERLLAVKPRTRQASRMLGPYELITEIGRGGMGTLYLAMHKHMKRSVALKMLSNDRLKSQESRTRFQREMEAIGRMSHPNIVVAHDAGEHEECHFLVMEFLDGIDIERLTSRLTILNVPDACEIIRQAAVGLHYAHQQGMVHRDVKPSNLMLVPGSVTDSTTSLSDDQSANIFPIVKVLDLGLARFEDADASELTTAGQLMGTVNYMSPEQALDSHQVDQSTDVYSLGATLFRLLTGRAPWDDAKHATVGRKLRALNSEQLPSIAVERPDLPADLIAIVDRMLHRDRAQRYATAQEVVDALQPFTDGHDLARLLELAGVQSVSDAERIEETKSILPPPVGCSQLGSKPALPTDERHRSTRPVAMGATLITVLALVGILLWSRGGEQVYSTSRDGLDPAVPSDIEPWKAVESLGSDASSTMELAEADANLNRVAARWVLQVGGRVSVQVAGQRPAAVRSLDELPAEPFQVRQIKLLKKQYITNASLAHLQGLTGLRSLFLNSTAVPGDGLKFLADSKELEELSLCELPLAEDALKELQHFPNLQFLNLNLAEVNDTSLRHLPELKQLQYFSLRATQITDEGMDPLNRFPSLSSLVLADTLVAAAGLAKLHRLHDLEMLNLVNCRQIADDAIEQFQSSKKLTKLLISGTSISDQGLLRIAEMKQLELVQVGGVNMTKPGIDLLRSRLPLCKFIESGER